MFGKKEWFRPKTFGWGLRPVCWQGWVYAGVWTLVLIVPFIGLLTRGEEVGFVGAVKHFESAYLAKARRPLMVVSLEASRTLTGAIIGKGPVVRLGDRRTVFDAGGLQVLSQLAERLLPKAHQRRIMDGGACEALPQRHGACLRWVFPSPWVITITRVMRGERIAQSHEGLRRSLCTFLISRAK